MELPKDKMVILFDGVCNLCNSSVRFVEKRDRKDRFRYASLQSEVGRQLTGERGIDREKMDSIILIDPGVAYYVKSDAALEIARHLKGWSWLPLLVGWIPRSLRNPVYDLIARNRYRWFGRQDECMIPTKAQQAKFLDS